MLAYVKIPFTEGSVNFSLVLPPLGVDESFVGSFPSELAVQTLQIGLVLLVGVFTFVFRKSSKQEVDGFLVGHKLATSL